jgi:hypothetical protein
VKGLAGKVKPELWHKRGSETTATERKRPRNEPEAEGIRQTGPRWGDGGISGNRLDPCTKILPPPLQTCREKRLTRKREKILGRLGGSYDIPPRPRFMRKNRCTRISLFLRVSLKGGRKSKQGQWTASRCLAGQHAIWILGHYPIPCRSAVLYIRSPSRAAGHECLGSGTLGPVLKTARPVCGKIRCVP